MMANRAARHPNGGRVGVAAAMLGVASYERVSTDEQRERATIETQHVEIDKHLVAHERIQAGRYVDDGWSGRKLSLRQRPGGARLLADAAAGLFDAVVVYRVDRLGRGRKLMTSLDELLEAGVRYIISVTETSYDLHNSNDEFHLTMLSGVSGYEANGFLQRSRDATNRLAREGQWLGGIVPYGYRVEGEDRAARLVVSDEPIRGFTTDLSEAGVIRLIYRRTVSDDWSCQRIADELNALGVPSAYIRDGRMILRGKRARTVQGIWRAGRIRNMIVNTTYKGLHEYGKRSLDAEREVIARAVPAIVDEQTWQVAQERLRAHMRFSRKNAKREYLLRGLISCGCCGLNYCGCPQLPLADGTEAWLYKCNGSAQFRGIYGKRGERCPSKAIRGDLLEAAVWADVEMFLRNPGSVLDELAAQMQGREQRGEALQDEIAEMKLRISEKQAERDYVVTLARRQRIDSATLERQLDTIAEEEADLQAQLAAHEAAYARERNAGAELQSAEVLLRELHARLDAPLTFAIKRQVIETLVASVIVDTVRDEATGKRHTKARVVYCFQPPDGHDPNDPRVRQINVTATRTDMGSWRKLT